jgi:hypothetical protein
MKKLSLFFLSLLIGTAAFADTKISALPAAAAQDGTEVVPEVQAGATVKATTAAVANAGAQTGDVTKAVGSGVTTIAVGAVTDTKGSLAVKPAVTVVATSNQALTGTPTIDGQVTADGSIILNTAQSAGAENGPWVAHAGAWTRPTWYAAGNTTQAFQFITTFVRLGSTYQGTTWRQTAAAPITIGTTATTWAIAPLALNSSTVTGTLPSANGGVVYANPTGTVGLTAVNGVATTAMRSDAAPPIDQSIAPVWTGSHTFTNTVGTSVSSTEPRVNYNETDQTTDEKLWGWDLNTKIFTGRTRTDADGAGVNWIAVTRGTGTAISNLSLGNATDNPTFNFLGTGTVTATGNIAGNQGLTANGGSILVSNTVPRVRWQETDASTDLKVWQALADSSIWTLSTLTDANAAGKSAIAITRGPTTAISNVSLGNATDNPTFNWLGTGTSTFGGAVTTGTNSLTAGIFLTNGGTPAYRWAGAGGTDQGRWQMDAVTSATWKLSSITDASAAGTNILLVTRGTGTAIASMAVGNATDNPSTTFLGTGFVQSNGSFRNSSVLPELRMIETDQASDLKNWSLQANGAVLTGTTQTDAGGAGKNFLAVTRGATTAIASMDFGNATDNPTYNFLGTGTVVSSGALQALRFNVSGATVASVGIYRPGTNRLGFGTNGTYRGEFDASGQFIIGTLGAGLSIKEGSNAKMGVCTLVAGTCTVSTTAVTASSRIFLTEQALGTVAIPSALAATTVTAGTSFVVTASAATDTSVVAWMLVEPSP